jgi:hypothetical protein
MPNGVYSRKKYLRKKIGGVLSVFTEIKIGLFDIEFIWVEVNISTTEGGHTMYKRTKQMCHLENPPNI